VLQPFAEKQRHLDWFAETLQEEIAEEFPLSPEAIKDLKDLQRLWNLRDEDVEPVMREVLLEQGPEHKRWLAVWLHSATRRDSQAVNEKPEKSASKQLTADSAWNLWPMSMLRYSFETVRVNEQGEIIKRLPGKAEYFVEDLGNGVTLEMVYIPGGEFWMGSPDGEDGAFAREKPHHPVTVPEFWLGKFAVTQAQYEAITGKNPSRFTENGQNRPVERVTWYAAVAFCEALTVRTGREYRLPSEAEWEYACRAGTTTPFYFGPTITTELANYDSNEVYGSGPKGTSRGETTEVGQFPPNAFGLYDMHGNVREWCQDGWHDSYEGAPTDGSAWMAGGDRDRRILRGGAWNTPPRVCRSANRNRNLRGNDNNNVGFRVVCVSARALLSARIDGRDFIERALGSPDLFQRNWRQFPKITLSPLVW
jgi:formylglycine-generating enzyme required for sulfatase activity